MSQIDQAIADAADVIAQFSQDAADAFRSQPFSRVDIACAFARGFVDDDSDDISPVAMPVIRVAMIDRQMRAASQ